jgi:hypothetical protein
MSVVVRTGLITGLLSSVLWILMFLAPSGLFSAIGQYGAILVFLAGIYLSIKRTRDTLPNEQIDFKTGLKAGFGAGFIAALLFSTTQFILWNAVNPTDEILAMAKYGFSNNDMLTSIRNRTIGNYMSGSVALLIGMIIVAFFMSIIASLVLCRRGGLFGESKQLK